MSSKDSGKQELILGVAEANVAYGPDVADSGADDGTTAAGNPRYRP